MSESAERLCEQSPATFRRRYRLSLVQEAEVPYNAELISCQHPENAVRFLERVVEGYAQEAMGALYLDCRNRAIAHTIAFLGTLARTSTEPRQILATGLLVNAAGMILFHNHPSGDPTPSAEDLAFTRRMAGAGELVGIKLVDHLIIGDGTHVSLRDRGGW